MSTTLVPDGLERCAGSCDAPPNFDRMARIYRWMEWLSFGPILWWCRCAFLGEMRGCRRALIFGDGDGRFTARLLRENPDVDIEAIDASPAMLEALVRRAGLHAPRVRTACQDARNWQPGTASHDLIVTHFFLDCLTSGEVQSLAVRVRASAAPDARWVISEFAVPASSRFGRWVARPVVSLLYWAFGVLTGLRQRRLPDHREALRAAGFRLLREKRWLCGLLVSQLWAPE
jgi:ubiquinone/menaquinone biosynthesis C-methylase UbiE